MNTKVTLLYPPDQSWSGTMCKPNGSLAYPYLAGALRDNGINVNIFDACVGNEKDDLNKIFYKSTKLLNYNIFHLYLVFLYILQVLLCLKKHKFGMIRTGVSDKRILDEIKDSDIVGLTSIFSSQEFMVLYIAKLIKQKYPNKLIVVGGVNARNRYSKFLDNYVDIVCMGESEYALTEISKKYSNDVDGWLNYIAIPNIAYNINGNISITHTTSNDICHNLDELPIPAWDLLPNERYWKIRRPHGGHFPKDKELRYASMMTSRGCVFSCSYCHISKETNKDVCGNIGKFRIKSDDRVLREIKILKSLGIKHIFIEDDSFLSNKIRAKRLLQKMSTVNVNILLTNGINIAHMFNIDGSVDMELLICLKKAGVKEIVLGFESGCQRIIDKYASSKWNIQKLNIARVLRQCNIIGIRTIGNYMLGFPDETRDELEQTVYMARKHKKSGLDQANFFCVVPLPGSKLYDSSIEHAYLDKSHDVNKLTWLKGNFVNTIVSSKELETIRNDIWEELNSQEHINTKKSMRVDYGC